VQALPHFLARLEVGHALRWHVDRIARTRIAPRACIAEPGREGAETAQFDAAAFGEPCADLVEKDVDDLLDLFRPQFRIVRCQGLQEFGSNHQRPFLAVAGEILFCCLCWATAVTTPAIFLAEWPPSCNRVDGECRKLSRIRAVPGGLRRRRGRPPARSRAAPCAGESAATRARGNWRARPRAASPPRPRRRTCRLRAGRGSVRRPGTAGRPWPRSADWPPARPRRPAPKAASRPPHSAPR